MAAIEIICWVCGQPASWKITATKEGEPALLVEIWSCDKCVPFSYEMTPQSREENAQ